MMNRRTEYQDCTKCAAFNVNLGMNVNQDKARYGELAPLSTHACSALGVNTSNCCLYDENTDQCALSFNDEFLHPCAYCGKWGGLTVENITEINFPKAEHCTACTKYYPEGSTGDPIGDISSLTNHACGNYDQNTFNCCLYDETNDRCGVFENHFNGNFLYPCICGAGEEIGKKVGIGIGITVGLLFLIICCWWYLRKRRSRHNSTNEHNIPANEVPTPVQLPSVVVPIDTNMVAVPVEVTQVLYAEIVDVKVNDGIPSAPELPPPIPAPAVSRRPMEKVTSKLPSEGLKPWSIPRPPATADFPLDVSPRGVVNLPYIEGEVTSCSIAMSNPSSTSYYAYELVVTPVYHYDSKPNMGILPPGQSESIRITLKALFCNRGKDFLNCSEVKVKIRACAVHASSAEQFLHTASSIEDTLNRTTVNGAMWREVKATKAHVHNLVVPLRLI